MAKETVESVNCLSGCMPLPIPYNLFILDVPCRDTIRIVTWSLCHLVTLSVNQTHLSSWHKSDLVKNSAIGDLFFDGIGMYDLLFKSE